VPLYHALGTVSSNLVGLQFASTLVYPSEGFDAAASLKAITEEKCSVIYGVPTMFTANLKELEAAPEKYDVSSLRTGLIAGSVCPPPLIKRIIDDMGMDGLTIIFGMTELSCLGTLMKPGDSLEKKMTTTGPVGPHTEIKIVDNDGRTVPQGV
jgi:fatty-acyl-CoA synthase